MVKEKKAEFEQKLQKENGSPEEEEKGGFFSKFKKKKRQRRTTEEIIQDRLAEAVAVDPKQVELFKPVIKLPFEVWADNTKVEDLRLKDDEAGNLAMPIAQLVNYYLPRLSPVGYVWLSLGLSSFSIMSLRFKLLAGLRGKQKEKAPPEKKDE